MVGREVGKFRGEVPVPAINELRYAGHHIVQAISDDGTIDVEEDIADPCLRW